MAAHQAARQLGLLLAQEVPLERAVERGAALVVLAVVLLGRGEVLDELVGEAGHHDALDAGAGHRRADRVAQALAHLAGGLARLGDDQPAAHADGHQRHRLRHACPSRARIHLVPLPGRRRALTAALEVLLGHVVERPALLLRAGQEREARHRVVGHPAALGLLAAEAHARPAQVERRRARDGAARVAPGAQHGCRLDAPDVVRRRRARSGRGRPTGRPRWCCRRRSAPPGAAAPCRPCARAPRTPASPRRSGRRCRTGTSTW